MGMDAVHCYVVDGKGEVHFSCDGHDAEEGLRRTARAMVDANIERSADGLEGHVTVNGLGRTLDLDDAQSIVEAGQ